MYRYSGENIEIGSLCRQFEYDIRNIRFRERQRLTATALHRFTVQPEVDRSSALPCLAILGVYPNLSTIRQFTRFADDFVIVTDTRAHAENWKSRLQKYLRDKFSTGVVLMHL